MFGANTTFALEPRKTLANLDRIGRSQELQNTEEGQCDLECRNERHLETVIYTDTFMERHKTAT